LFQVFLTVDVIGSRFGTLVAALHILAIALIGTYALQGRVRLRPVPLIRFAVVSVILLAAALLGIRAFYSHVYVAAYSMDEVLTGLALVEEPQPHVVHRDLPEELRRQAGAPSDLATIRQRGVLRACFVPDDYPSSFFNTAGDLVGFDIEVAHRFAGLLDMPIDFLAVQSVDEAASYLDNGYCDVFMSLFSISPSRTERFAMTSPVRREPIALIVRDHRRSVFRTWRTIREMPQLRVAVSGGSVIRSHVERFLPSATVVPLESVAEIEAILGNLESDIDAIVRYAEEAAAWSIRFPHYSFITPSPTVFVPAGYAVASGNLSLLEYLEIWLLNAEASGTLDALYRYWMLGEVRESQPPRWSVIRDVLGWID
jgi:ABC-type amino acid transport substrate-binding protein